MVSGLYGQYSETFPDADKGILSGPCTGTVGTTCLVSDFTGVNWTIEGDLTGVESFATNNANQLVVADIDEEACWVSPVLTITGASAAFALDLSWLSYEDYDVASVGSKDFIAVQYRVNGGSWVEISNVVGSGPRTISYVGNAVGMDGSANNVGASGIVGSTLQIRVCIDNNSIGETTTISNVSATNAGIGGPPMTCDLAISSISVIHEDCPNANDGRISVSATTSNGPLTYSISGPVSRSNATGIFTGLPDGSYNILVRDNAFTSGACDRTASRTINAGVDNTNPTASNPATLNLTCPSQVPAANPAVVTDEADNCIIPCTTTPWINEFHYDADGTETGEFIEIAGPAGLNLNGYTIYTYDGSDRMVDQIFPLSGIIDNEQNGFGALTFATPNLQNQTEGIALVRNSGSIVIEFLSYEGSFIAVDGPAFGLTSKDVGVEEPANQAANESLSRIGSGNAGSEFGFVDQTASSGNKNGSQTFLACPENVPAVTLQGQTTTGLGNQASPLVITRTYRVTDAAGNFKDVFHTINVTDAQAPSITCPTGITVSTATGECSAVVTYSTPTASDNCGAVTVTRILGSASGSTFPVGTSTILYEAEDQVANTKECSFTVTVLDQENPLLVCPSNIVKNNDPGECGAVVTYTPPVGADNCSVISTDPIGGLGSGAFFQVGTTTERYEAADASGNTKECSFTVTVKDAEAPAILTCPADIEVFTDPGLCQATVNYPLPTFSDNCAVTDVVEDNGWQPNDVFPEGVTQVVYRGFDAALNSSAPCIFDITVKDKELPTLNCVNSHQVSLEADGTFDLLKGVSQEGPYLQMLLFTKFEDNCDVDLAFIDYNPHDLQFDCGDLGDNYVIFFARDVNGNLSSCRVNIIVTDTESACNQAPVANCQNIVVNADAVCQATITAEQINDGSFDPDGDGLTFSLNDYGPFSKGMHTVELTVSDGQLSDKCTATVTVLDVTAPVKPAAPTSVSGSCASDVPVEIMLTAIDACDGPITVSPTTVKINGSCDNRFEMIRTWTFTDQSGNSSSVSQTITISDETGPTLSMPTDVTIECDESTLPANTGTATAIDNCYGAITPGYSDSVTDIQGDNCYTILRTWTATDACGNSNSKVQRIVVQDTKKPVLTIPPDITIECDESTGTDNTGSASASDNCDARVSIRFSDKQVDVFASGCYTIERTWTASDECGNSSSKVQRIRVQDTKAPVFTYCPANVEVDCNLAIPAVGSPTATDNCDASVFISYLGEVRDNSCGRDYYTLTRSWEAEDNCGNTKLCEQVITVNTLLSDGCFNLALDMSYNASNGTTRFSWELCVEDNKCQDLSNIQFSLPCEVKKSSDVSNAGSSFEDIVVDYSGKPGQCGRYAIVFENFGNGGIKGESGGCATFYYTLKGDYRSYKTNVDIKAGRERGLGFAGVGAGCDCDGSVPYNSNLAAALANTEVPASIATVFRDVPKVRAYPNPASAEMTLEFNLPESTRAMIDLYDLQGRRLGRIFEQDIDAGITYRAQIDRLQWNLPQGTYFYRLQAGAHTLQGKVVFLD
jgi:hypothetical protein